MFTRLRALFKRTPPQPPLLEPEDATAPPITMENSWPYDPEPTPKDIYPTMDPLARRQLEMSGPACIKCATSFIELPPLIKYADDDQHGERILFRCPACSYRWTTAVKTPEVRP